MTQYSPELEKLFADVKKIHPAEIKINYPKQAKVGYIRHDQGQQYVADGMLQVDVYDQTAPEYVISHELIHFMLLLNNTPQVSLNLTTGDQKLDQTLAATGIDLYDTVLHAKVYQEQRKRGFITEETEKLYLKGVVERFPKEEEGDQWLVLRVLTFLDALVFFDGKDPEIVDLFSVNNPRSYYYAEKLYDILTQKPLKTNTAVRRAVVNLWQAFDQVLIDAGYAPMKLNQFVTLTPVLSERQARLQVNQLFEFFHSPLQENTSFKDAFIGRLRADDQNSFVIPEPADASPEEFKRLYETPIGQYLREIGFSYLTRD